MASYFMLPQGQEREPEGTTVSTCNTTANDAPNVLLPGLTPPVFQDDRDYPVTQYKEREIPPEVELSSRQSILSRLRQRSHRNVWRRASVFLGALICFQLYLHIYSINRDPLAHIPKEWKTNLHLTKRPDPMRWLEEKSYPNDLQPNRPKAALISLVRNEELGGILQSMRQLELHWNKRHNYPWVFFNERPFSDEFKAATRNATSASIEYHLVPRAHWTTPPHINQTLYHNSLDYLSLTSVGKGHLLSYHAMIRWQSGLFYLHPALARYDYYWRVEPDVHFFCDILYDPFSFLRNNDLVYGFNMAILDDARSFASLWSTTRDFILAHPHLVHPDSSLSWLLDRNTGLTYNNCQFFSNFEIGSLNFFRSNAGNRAYFDYLDEKGGFYYSRWGDAPVHTLSVSMFADPSQIWWFRDIGYQHDIARHCPPSHPFRGLIPKISQSHPAPFETHALSRKADHDPGPSWPSGRCTCEPTSLDENFYKLVPMESPQVKPVDTCIRLWLGGEWLRKKEGWDAEAERMVGGDGYGGYLRDGL